MLLARLFVIAMLIAILASLFSALLFLYRDGGKGTRMVKALTWRIGLSITLFLLLAAGFYSGILPSGGLHASP